MVVVFVLLLLLALVCFALAAFSVAVGKINLVAAGLFLATLVPFIQELRRL